MIFIRHGESHFNVVYGATRQDPGIVDPGLTGEGRRQVESAAESLRPTARTHIVSSPYRRALETAEILAEALELAVSVEPLIRERAYFTCDIGSPASELKARWPDFHFSSLPERWWPEPEETEAELDRRCRRFHRDRRRANDWRGLLVVSHWGFIRALTGEAVTNAQLVPFDPDSAAAE